MILEKNNKKKSIPDWWWPCKIVVITGFCTHWHNYHTVFILCYMAGGGEKHFIYEGQTGGRHLSSLTPFSAPPPYPVQGLPSPHVRSMSVFATVIGFNTLISWSYDKFNVQTDSHAFLRCCLFILDTEMPSNFKQYWLTGALNPANVLLAMLFLQTPCRVSRDFDIVIGETRTVLDVSWKRSIANNRRHLLKRGIQEQRGIMKFW